MKNYFNKQTIIAFITGVSVSLSLSAFATEYIINSNNFPIIVNGVQKDVETLNINGFTWLKLADVGKATGLSVKFNEVEKQVEINNSTVVVNNGSSGAYSSKKETLKAIPTKTPTHIKEPKYLSDTTDNITKLTDYKITKNNNIPFSARKYNENIYLPIAFIDDYNIVPEFLDDKIIFKKDDSVIAEVFIYDSENFIYIDNLKYLNESFLTKNLGLN